MGLRMMLGIGIRKLTEYVKENNGIVAFDINTINEWLKKEKYPFTVMCIDDPIKGRVLKLVLTSKT